jgi:transcriptional regulator GlxA family with amidase domain
LPKRIIFPIVDCFEVFDLAGPMQVLHEANNLGADYELVFAALDRKVEAVAGLTVSGLLRLPRVGPADVIIIPGSGAMLDPKRRTETQKLVVWLRESHACGARIATVCVGAFLLGRAGLLDGRKCTTHWKRAEELAKRFPRANVLRDQLFVFDGPIVTSAGISAGVDMTLALVEADHGTPMVAKIAREMVLHVRRQGAESQLNPLLGHRDHLESGVHAVQDLIVHRPGERHSLDDLAGVAGVSRRHLTRLFRAATGISIAEYHTAIRLEHARALLADPELTIDAVAERCGLSDGRHLRRLWREAFGTSPSDARVSA